MKTKLREGEEVKVTLRKHAFTLVPPMFWSFVLVMISVFGYQSNYKYVFLVGTILTTLWLVYKIWDRKTNIWAVTNFRVIDESGVFTINSKESPLHKIHNVSYRQPILGRIFNFGSVQIQTAAERGASVHTMVERPKLLKDTITSSQNEYERAFLNQHKTARASTSKQSKSSLNIGLAEELTKLHELMEKGIISEEEFQQLKAKILAS